MKIEFSWRQIFEILIIYKPILRTLICSPTQHFGPIGSAVLTFIGYKKKQTNKQTMLMILYVLTCPCIGWVSSLYYEVRYCTVNDLVCTDLCLYWLGLLLVLWNQVLYC